MLAAPAAACASSGAYVVQLGCGAPLPRSLSSASVVLVAAVELTQQLVPRAAHGDAHVGRVLPHLLNHFLGHTQEAAEGVGGGGRQGCLSNRFDAMFSRAARAPALRLARYDMQASRLPAACPCVCTLHFETPNSQPRMLSKPQSQLRPPTLPSPPPPHRSWNFAQSSESSGSRPATGTKLRPGRCRTSAPAGSGAPVAAAAEPPPPRPGPPAPISSGRC